jgi:hypothetical protein
MARTTKTITFDTERDADLLAWLEGQKNQAEAVRAALRAAIAPQASTVTLDQVYRAIQELKSKIQSGPVMVQAETETQNGDAPGTEAAAMALDSLGL